MIVAGGVSYSRSDLVLKVANQDGGGHVDPGLDDAYHDLSRGNSVGWLTGVGDTVEPLSTPVLATVRQIAFEVLWTAAKELT